MFRWLFKPTSPTRPPRQPDPAQAALRADALARWKARFPLGSGVRYLGHMTTVVANYSTLDNGQEIPCLRIAWITDDGRHDMVSMDGLAASNLAEAGLVVPEVQS